MCVTLIDYPKARSKSSDRSVRPTLLVIAREELCHLAKLGVTGGDQFLRCASLQFGELFFERGVEQGGGGFVINVGATLGFGHDAIDATQLLQVVGCDAH